MRSGKVWIMKEEEALMKRHRVVGGKVQEKDSMWIKWPPMSINGARVKG